MTTIIAVVTFVLIAAASGVIGNTTHDFFVENQVFSILCRYLGIGLNAIVAFLNSEIKIWWVLIGMVSQMVHNSQ